MCQLGVNKAAVRIETGTGGIQEGESFQPAGARQGKRHWKTLQKIPEMSWVSYRQG